MKTYIWGDSIGQGVIFDTERRRYRLSKNRCTNLIREAGEDLDNHARMGATILDGYEDFLTTDTEPGSALIIEFGGNDCNLNWDSVAADPEGVYDGKVSLPRFREMLDAFIGEGRRRGLHPVLVTPPPLCAKRFFDWVSQGKDSAAILRYLGDVEHIYRWQELYARAVNDAAFRNRCPLLDLRGMFLLQDRFEDLMCVDGMHPNEEGQIIMAKYALSELKGHRAVLCG